MRHVKAVLLIVLAASVMAMTCAAHAQNSAKVMIQGYAFQPQSVTIVKGGTVTWTNQDAVVHDVTFDDGNSPSLGSGATFAKTFNDAGTFNYHCSIHPSMTGKVIVQ